MHKASLLKVALFALAIYASINYLLFLLNPAHADNPGFFLVTAIADLIAIVNLASTAGVALFSELRKDTYHREIAELRAAGRHLAGQRVAVLLPVVSEDIRIIRHTLESLLALRGDKVIYVLDDGRREATEALCRELGVRYITRPDNAFFKAGNLNHGLRYVREEFVVVVDADFSLSPAFLERTLPLFVDPTVGAVQTPQLYDNADTLFSKGSLNMQAIFYDHVLPGKHLLNSAFCVGTNVIYRRSALNAIGGVPSMKHSEDIFTALGFLEHGYRVFFLNERLAMGLSPSTLLSFFNQQYRWSLGGFTMLLRHPTLLNHKLRLDQRVQFFLSNVFYLTGVSMLIYLLSPLVAVFFGVKPVAGQYIEQWWTSYSLFFIASLLIYLVQAGKYRLQSVALGMYSFIPFVASLGSVLVGAQFRWKPTNSASVGLITKILSPLIVYLTAALATGYLLLTGAIPLRSDFVSYYVWLALDLVLVLPVIFAGYFAKPRFSLPQVELEPQEIVGAYAPAAPLAKPAKPPIPAIPASAASGAFALGHSRPAPANGERALAGRVTLPNVWAVLQPDAVAYAGDGEAVPVAQARHATLAGRSGHNHANHRADHEE